MTTAEQWIAEVLADAPALTPGRARLVSVMLFAAAEAEAA